MSNPLWLVVSAPSGAGKTTLVKNVLKKHQEFGFSVSVTTRPPRAGEKNGWEYHFVSEKKFLRLRKAGKLLEWAKIHGFYYGTPARPLQSRKNCRVVFFDVNRQGARAIKKVFPQAVLVFIFPPGWKTLKSRLSGRGTESKSELKRRLIDAKREMAAARRYDYWIVNQTVDASVKRLEAILTAELSRPA
ncbi:MAG: guanylate kinase, partial [candidate division Zixibacteria bacterium]|nr:guanylate kinase [candidate division Zixibacteria bacterium]